MTRQAPRQVGSGNVDAVGFHRIYKCIRKILEFGSGYPMKGLAADARPQGTLHMPQSNASQHSNKQAKSAYTALYNQKLIRWNRICAGPCVLSCAVCTKVAASV